MWRHFACPIRKKYLYNHPKKFNRFVYFHSDTDPVAMGGRIPEQELMQNGLGSVMLANRVFNYSLYGRPISALLSLWGLSKTVTPLAETFFGSDNIFPVYPNKSVTGIHSLINDQNLGHSEVTGMAQFLPEIMTKLETKYPNDINKSVLFEANCYTNIFKQDPYDSVSLIPDTKHRLV